MLLSLNNIDYRLQLLALEHLSDVQFLFFEEKFEAIYFHKKMI